MRKLFWLLLIVGLIGSFMTNPNEKDFNEFIVDKYKKEINESDPIRLKLRNLLIKPATFLSALSLKTEDYKLCSTYTLINLNGKEEKYLGVFKTFVKL
jgi:hypothetical protein